MRGCARPCARASAGARTAVRHADADGLHARLGAAVDERLHARDERLAALSRARRRLGTGSPPPRRHAGGEQSGTGTEAVPHGDAAPPRSCCQRPRHRLHSKAEPRSAQHRRRAVRTAGPAAARPAASPLVRGARRRPRGRAPPGQSAWRRCTCWPGTTRTSRSRPAGRACAACAPASTGFAAPHSAPGRGHSALAAPAPRRARPPSMPGCAAASPGACRRMRARDQPQPAPRAARLVHCGPSAALTHARERGGASRLRARMLKGRMRGPGAGRMRTASAVSMRSRSQLHWSRTGMCMYCARRSAPVSARAAPRAAQNEMAGSRAGRCAVFDPGGRQGSGGPAAAVLRSALRSRSAGRRAGLRMQWRVRSSLSTHTAPPAQRTALRTAKRAHDRPSPRWRPDIHMQSAAPARPPRPAAGGAGRRARAS